jgi:type I restriction enzyme S subunit
MSKEKSIIKEGGELSRTKIPQGYKQTEIGVIPEDWEEKRLDDIFSISAGRDLVKDSYSKINDDIHSVPIYSNSLENKGLYGYTRIPRHKENCITITARGTIGRANARSHKFDAIGRLLILEPIKDLDCIFISEYLNNRVQFSIESTGVPQLTAPQAAKYLVAYPEQKEQHVIASVFSDIDTLIAELENLIAKKRAIKQGVMQELLTGRRRLPGFSGKWEVKTIKDIFRNTRGQVLAMTKISSNKLGEYQYPVYSSQTRDNGLAGYFTDYLFENCITWTTDGANAGDVKFRVGRFYCTNVCGVLESKEGYSNPCIAEIFNRVSKKYVSYVGNPKLMNNVVREIKITIPNSIEEQIAIGDILSDMDSEIDKLEQQLAKYQLVKQGMMQILLTGKVRLV